ncbi:MAG: o-succinylbenzoate synthase [Gammaproteobacteria bacterium]|nr:o-succinylbenzoate synthase [Gammaproteobacteria bacterium]MBU1731268.1 o-succinylbenzoate synthase [Gammaproteobacteria bacterium]MBU1892773.1 o-succinylbenzoate synthase [Gammaproteobacteria bacterium]
MRIRASRIIPYRLPLRAEWISAQGSFAARCGWLLRLETDAGLAGWGDCAPLPEHDAAEELEALARVMAGMDMDSAWDGLRPARQHPAVRCAVDVALGDLAAQQAGQPLAHWLAPDAAQQVRCNAALGALDAGVSQRAQAAIAEGFEVLKLKVGMAPVGHELALLRQLADDLPIGILLRLDANRAWNIADAQRFITGMAGLPLEMLEEPLAQPDLTDLATLQAQTEIPLALDESLPELGLERVLATIPVQRMVLKPMITGGLQAALKTAQGAHEAGMTCVVTTSVDSAVGTLAALHLAAALNNGLHHGLATSGWLKRDVGSAPRPELGMMTLGELPGLGFVPNPEILT